uniref:Uncharacterized protein n=1 Tax=Rhizophora mucronata TaxID=61149 RepID=A0A2P2J518_RHIMU
MTHLSCLLMLPVEFHEIVSWTNKSWLFTNAKIYFSFSNVKFLPIHVLGNGWKKSFIFGRFCSKFAWSVFIHILLLV